MRLFNEQFAQMELWLRPGIWGGGTYSAVSALLLLDLMCGKKLDPKDAKEHFELIRGRAWKILRNPKPGQAGYADEWKDTGPAGLSEMIPVGALRLSRLTKVFPP